MHWLSFDALTVIGCTDCHWMHWLSLDALTVVLPYTGFKINSKTCFPLKSSTTTSSFCKKFATVSFGSNVEPLSFCFCERSFSRICSRTKSTRQVHIYLIIFTKHWRCYSSSPDVVIRFVVLVYNYAFANISFRFVYRPTLVQPYVRHTQQPINTCTNLSYILQPRVQRSPIQFPIVTPVYLQTSISSLL